MSGDRAELGSPFGYSCIQRVNNIFKHSFSYCRVQILMSRGGEVSEWRGRMEQVFREALSVVQCN